MEPERFAKKLCLIHANCQGEPLMELLGGHPEFSAAYRFHYTPNYTGTPGPREVAALVTGADLYLHQFLNEKWGETASQKLLPLLPTGARSLCLPNLLFKGYWPYWISGPMQYEDRLLNMLIGRGLSAREIVHIYLHTDLRKLLDPLPFAERSWDIEREKEKDWDVKAVELVMDLFRRERLFNTHNHPGKRLCLHVANGVLRLLGLAPLGDSQAREFADPFPEFVMPTHPQIAELMGLEFLAPDTRYHVYGRDMDFVEYVNYYIDCRKQGEEDFISYLRLAAKVRS